MNSSGRTAFALGALGLIPFAGFALAIVTGFDLMGLNARIAFLSYSAIILSFMAGTLWGRAVVLEDTNVRIPLLLSNALALAGWAALLLQAFHISIIILASGFLVTRLAEIKSQAQLARVGLAGYASLRNLLTAVVTILHLLIFALTPVAT